MYMYLIEIYANTRHVLYKYINTHTRQNDEYLYKIQKAQANNIIEAKKKIRRQIKCLFFGLFTSTMILASLLASDLLA